MSTNYTAKLSEHDALPDDLNSRLQWIDDNPPPTITVTCRCKRSKPREFQLTWDDVRTELRLYGTVRPSLESWQCEVCEPDTETEGEQA